MKSGSGPKALYLASVKVGETTVQEDSIQVQSTLDIMQCLFSFLHFLL